MSLLTSAATRIGFGPRCKIAAPEMERRARCGIFEVAVPFSSTGLFVGEKGRHVSVVGIAEVEGVGFGFDCGVELSSGEETVFDLGGDWDFSGFEIRFRYF